MKNEMPMGRTISQTGRGVPPKKTSNAFKLFCANMKYLKKPSIPRLSTTAATSAARRLLEPFSDFAMIPPQT